MKSPGEIRAMVNAKLDHGDLPRRPPKRMWGGPGNGETCAACDDAVVDDGVLEVNSADDKTRHYHPRCYTIVSEERRRQPGHAG